MLYIIQFYAELHTGARCESPKQVSLALVLLRDEKTWCFNKINRFIHEDTECKFFGCQNISSELFTVCFWAGYEVSRSIFQQRVKRRAAVLSVSVNSYREWSITIELLRLNFYFKRLLN